MSAKDPIELNIKVSVEGACDEDIDLMTRQLLAELRERDVESAELTKGDPAPVGSKGDPFTIGSIAIEILPAAVPGLMKFIQAWMARGRGRTVKFRGMGIEFEGSSEELEKILALLESGRRKR